MLGDLPLVDYSLVDLHTLYAAMVNPQCHYFLALEKNDCLEYCVEADYLFELIEEEIGT